MENFDRDQFTDLLADQNLNIEAADKVSKINRECLVVIDYALGSYVFLHIKSLLFLCIHVLYKKFTGRHTWDAWHFLLLIPHVQRACTRVTGIALCVCVCLLSH